MDRVKNKAFGLLKWSEKYTKTDMIYLAKGGFWAVSSQLAVSLTSFLLAIAFAHFISKDAYGEYKYVLSLASILSTLTLTGLATSVQHSTIRGFDGSLRYAFWQNIRWSTLFFLSSFAISVYYFVNQNTFLGGAFLIAGSLSPFFVSTNLYSQFLVAKKDFKRNAIYFNMIGNVLPSICLIVTMFLTSKSLYLILVYFASNTLVGIILYLRVINIYKPNNSIDPEMMGYGKHLSFINILNNVASNIDQVLVFHYIGAAQLAIYNFATAIPNQIKGPVKSLSDLIFPKFTERSDVEIKKGMKNKFLQLFIFSLLIIVVYIVVAPYIYQIFFPKYSESVFYSQIFSISLLWIVFVPTNTYLGAKRKIKEQYLANVSISIVQIFFVIIGVIFGGLIGLIVARILGRIAWGVINTIAFYYSLREV
jgi:O-antigen/teichoic acid export membrane protein